MFHLGPAPAVDRLIVVAHHAQIVMGANECGDDLKLHLVRVLILVDLHVIELVLLATEYLGKLFK